MNDRDMQAHDMVRRRSWSRAVVLYDQVLSQLPPPAPAPSTAATRAVKDKQIACLLGRCECLLELGRYEMCLVDARKVLQLLAEQSECLASISRARGWLVQSLCKLKRYPEAEQTLREWMLDISGQQNFSDISKTLDRYKSLIQMICGQKAVPKAPYARLEDEMTILDTKLDHWAINNVPMDRFTKLLCNKGFKKRSESQHNGSASSNSSTSSGSGSNTAAAMQKTTDLLAAINLSAGKHGTDEDEIDTACTYCGINFSSRVELRQHCQMESHQNMIMSDEGRDWKWRPPPRGFTLDTYSLCEAYSESQTCHYGNQCVEAHGLEELNEWKDRFEYRRMRLQKACEKELYGKSYTEQILERWIQATAPDRIMCEVVEGIEVKCDQDLVTSVSSKSSKRVWTFVLNCRRPLRAVALLQDAHRNHFSIKAIKLGVTRSSTSPAMSLSSSSSSGTMEDVELKVSQEWLSPRYYDKVEAEQHSDSSTSDTSSGDVDCDASLIEHRENEVTIGFHTEIYGTFRQAVCFDFGSEPLLVKHLCVDVVPVSDAERIEEIKRDIINNSATRWDCTNSNLVKFETTIGTHLKTEAYLCDVKHEKEMLERYPCPQAATLTLTQSTIVEKRLTQNNYRSRIHELLYVEEIARYEQIARYNVRTKLMVASTYILTPAGMATSTAKYSLSGELFALMRLGKDISEDTSPGRLILSNCMSVYISAPEDPSVVMSCDRKRDVYEALIEDKGKNVIYLKLSAKCVEGMNLKSDTEIDVDIQFQLNRLPYCEWHNAVDKITDFRIIFPITDSEPNIPWTPKKQWSETCEPKLNAKQREAVNAITTSPNIKLPPILLIGPFGTGKTYTLAQAIKQLLTQPDAKILICTHSNSAADLYIKEYLHPWIEEGLEEATPLRVYYHKRWVATVNSVVQKYCIVDGAGNFRRPTVEDIMKHRIVVVTLSISMELSTLGLPKGYFTHILLDEAAQAMECEAIMPLALANDTTRIVLAGDHMQMSPELFSAFAKERKLHISLLERLYDHYPSAFPCKILLCENYRAHEAIIKFTSELFYDQKLIASGRQPRHDRFYPLTFFTTRGEDVQDKNSTAFYNNSEVYEVVERVSELRKKWPASWGKLNDAGIGIMTPYADQVFRIRSELRKRRMGGISVERVLNVQGKQFRAVFLSTVRTRRTCMPHVPTGGMNPVNLLSPTEDADYGFLSNSKLLNTAITRAQSLVAVVGDPIALCSIGRCRKVWERFIETCEENKSLYGITWSFLRSQLDGVELKRGYVLNPLAPEFIPRSLQPEAYLRDQAAMFLLGPGAPSNPHGQHPGHHPNVPQMPTHPNMMPGTMPGQMPPPHSAISNQQIPPMYAQHQHNAAAYNAAAAAAAAMMTQGMVPGKGGSHHFPTGPPNHMAGMRGIGQQPQQSQPPHGQQFAPRGPLPPAAAHLAQAPVPNTPGSAGQFPQYMGAPWPQTQQQIRGGLPPGANAGNFVANAQQPVPPQTQNANANLWGAPPQTTPWGSLPKQPLGQLQNAQNNGGRPMMQPPQQLPQGGIRGSSVPLQPSLNPQQQLRSNPSELGYLAKKQLFTQNQPQAPGPPQPHPNFPGFTGGSSGPPNMQMLNQRSLSGGISNGPISPMDPFMQQRTTAPGGGAPQTPVPQPPTQNHFFGNNNVGLLKDKDFPYMSNMHVPPLNVGGGSGGGNMFQGPGKQQHSPTHLRFPQPQEFVGLLPPNVNIYEMAFEPKESQYKWYLKLLDTHGQEAASKFTDGLRQVTNMLTQQQQQQQQQQQLQQQQQQQNKPQIPPMQSHINANQMMPRDVMQQQGGGMPPMLGGGATALGHQQQQQQRGNGIGGALNNLHPFVSPANNPLNPTPTNQPLALLPPSTDETPPLDGGALNFNHQIDLAFNSLMNGNEIAQPILRDLLGITGGNGGIANNQNNLMISINGDILLPPASTAAPIMPTSIAQQQHQQQQQAMQSKMFPGSMNSGMNAQQLHNMQQQQQKPLFTTYTPTPIQQIGQQPPQMQQQSQHQQPQLQQQQPPHLQLPLQQQPPQPPPHVQLGQSNQNYMGTNTLLNTKDLLLSTDLTAAAAAADTGPGGSVPLYRRQATNMPNGYYNPGHAGVHNANKPSTSTHDNPYAGATTDILAGLGTCAGTLIETLFTNNTTEAEQQRNNAAIQKMLYSTYNAGLKTSELDILIRDHLDSAAGSAASTAAATTGTNHHQAHNDSRSTTYASVLSQGSPRPPNSAAAGSHHSGGSGNVSGVSTHRGGGASGTGEDEKDPFAAIRELGQKTNGFYNYFQ